MKNLMKKKKTDIGKLKSKDAASVLNSLINAKKEYEITCEQETTKRMKIKADMDKYILKLQLQKEAFQLALHEEYSLRKQTIEEMFSYVERAYEDDKIEVVIGALNSIENIVKENPLQSIAKIGQAFEDDDVELEI